MVKPMWQLAPNEGHVRQNTIWVDIHLLAWTYAEQVFIIWWNYQSNKELLSISQPYEQHFSLTFWSRLADPTCFHHPHCDLVHPDIPPDVLLSIYPQIKSTGLLLEWYSLRQWHNCVYVDVTQFRNNSKLLSLTGLAIMQECRMSSLGCWRNSNIHPIYEPCLFKGCYWGTEAFISVACHRGIFHLNY